MPMFMPVRQRFAFLLLSWLSVLLIQAPNGLAQSRTARLPGARPNVLLIVGDDMGLADIGPYGSEIQTPHLNALAAEGVRFTNSHVTPVCSVTRAELLTGNNNIEVGLGSYDYLVYGPAKGKPGYEGYLTRNTVMISELLRDAGYNTVMAGKWHLGGSKTGGEGPAQWGFERSYGMLSGGGNHWNDEEFLPNQRDPKVQAALKAGKVPPVGKEPYYENGQRVTRPEGVYSDDLFTNQLIEYIEAGRKEGQPFFAYLPYTTAHFPLQAPQELIDQYEDHYQALGWDGLKADRLKRMQAAGVIPADVSLPPANPLVRKRWESLSPEQKRVQARVMATFAAMVDHQDRSIGRLLDYLEDTNQLDNTLIIYLGDNGPEAFDGQGGVITNSIAKSYIQQNYSDAYSDIGKANSNWQYGAEWANGSTGPMQWMKVFVAGGGVRTPLIIRPPEGSGFTRAGVIESAPVRVKDLATTILSYAGVERPERRYGDREIVPSSGVDLKPYLTGTKPRPRLPGEWMAFELMGNAYLIDGDYKVMRQRSGMWGDGQWHLYNIVLDPGETQPLDDAQPERLKRMVAQYEIYASEKGIVPVADDWNPWSSFGRVN